ncbi:MAG: amidohydrolase family protein [Pseudonocardia sp.]|uniref:amidohydrolase family protein n=1 Tax=unclassified Pseudonocardia TaxID=2619320 RepID=UPI000868E5BB|nr:MULTISPECIES: amidohydrolase family protein [unclassified Pseudonocardia]MBN9107149.1 amidohydrolase family protein [Pseudonocardia sp.]ODU26366.1 MAG: amidohydrolase [Pseudonocardia sp. SCN 72-51]ODV02701.1 MAG: amidohydrolase [Pseudonocardia sp. SCN 73-27]
MALLITDAEIDGRRRDLWIDRGRIAHPGTATDVIDARGGALLPGFVDHHLHLHALAAARRSVQAGRNRDDLAAALRRATPDPTGWIRVVGSDDDVLDAPALDRIRPGVPVRVQHRSGAMWVLNTAALTRVAPWNHPGLERDPAGTPTGRLHRGDGWLRDRLPHAGPPDLHDLGRELAASGITAVTDATPDLDAGTATALATVPQRLTLLGIPLGSGAPPGTTVGPYKIVLADSDLPTPDTLAERIRQAHQAGRPVAVHSVTRESLVLLLVALDAAGRLTGDRIEHAALVPEELVPALAGLAVVTQPGFVADRGDLFRRDVPPDEHPDLYRCRSLRAAGIPVAFSSDAPYGPVDPWAVLRAAITRHTPDGEPLGPAETLTPRQALAALQAPTPDAAPPTLRPGDAADLVLLHVPLAAALRAPDRSLVRTTFINGQPLN